MHRPFAGSSFLVTLSYLLQPKINTTIANLDSHLTGDCDSNKIFPPFATAPVNFQTELLSLTMNQDRSITLSLTHTILFLPCCCRGCTLLCAFSWRPKMLRCEKGKKKTGAEKGLEIEPNCNARATVRHLLHRCKIGVNQPDPDEISAFHSLLVFMRMQTKYDVHHIQGSTSERQIQLSSMRIPCLRR